MRKQRLKTDLQKRQDEYQAALDYAHKHREHSSEDSWGRTITIYIGNLVLIPTIGGFWVWFFSQNFPWWSLALGLLGPIYGYMVLRGLWIKVDQKARPWYYDEGSLSPEEIEMHEDYENGQS